MWIFLGHITSFPEIRPVIDAFVRLLRVDSPVFLNDAVLWDYQFRMGDGGRVPQEEWLPVRRSLAEEFQGFLVDHVRGVCALTVRNIVPVVFQLHT